MAPLFLVLEGLPTERAAAHDSLEAYLNCCCSHIKPRWDRIFGVFAATENVARFCVHACLQRSSRTISCEHLLQSKLIQIISKQIF
jgi:hypothetical protein